VAARQVVSSRSRTITRVVMGSGKQPVLWGVEADPTMRDETPYEGLPFVRAGIW
jgi:hypothetical protein